jgi:hypothetical protein
MLSVRARGCHCGLRNPRLPAHQNKRVGRPGGKGIGMVQKRSEHSSDAAPGQQLRAYRGPAERRRQDQFARRKTFGPSSGAAMGSATYALPEIWPVRIQLAPISMPWEMPWERTRSSGRPGAASKCSGFNPLLRHCQIVVSARSVLFGVEPLEKGRRTRRPSDSHGVFVCLEACFLFRRRLGQRRRRTLQPDDIGVGCLRRKVGFDKPHLFVDAARDLGEEIGGIDVTESRR